MQPALIYRKTRPEEDITQALKQKRTKLPRDFIQHTSAFKGQRLRRRRMRCLPAPRTACEDRIVLP